MIAILSLLHVVMSSVIQFDKSIHPMVLYENDLISIFMNVYVNLQKNREIIKYFYKTGGVGLVIRPTLGIFLCMTNFLVGPPEYTI